MVEDDYLLISGIQHFLFCKRQWALIYFENVWEDNVLTIQGKKIHNKIDNPEILDSRKNKFFSRSMPVVSHRLGIYGIIDIVEFEKVPKEQGIYLNYKNDYFSIKPIEYKRGRPKEDFSDIMQLCAQAICLEEMFGCKINYGYIFYNEIKHREKINFDRDLRFALNQIIKDMKEMQNSTVTPKSKKERKCINCSIYNYCFPEIFDKNVNEYIKKYIGMGG